MITSRESYRVEGNVFLNRCFLKNFRRSSLLSLSEKAVTGAGSITANDES